MKKTVFIVFIVVLAAVLAGYFITNQKAKPKYTTVDVEKGQITETITASGTINPVTTTNVGTQVSGTIQKIFADFNSPVKKGQLLAQIDPANFEAKAGQQRANLFSARANLNKIEASLENDRKTFVRYQNLYKKNFVAKSDVDLAETTYNSDLAQVEAAKAQIMQAQAALNSANTDLGYTKIISPVDGIVVSRNVDIGQTVAASFQTPTLFLVAQDLTKMQIDTGVAEADISKVRNGQDVEFTVDGYPDDTFKGKVIQVRNSPTTVQNVVTYDVVVSVDNKDMKLKPGMTTNVTIITDKKDDALLVPNECFRFVMPTKNKNKTPQKYKEKGIWMLGDNEKPARVEVKTGISDENNTEITAGYVHVGDKVITGLIEEGKGSKNDSQRSPMRMRMF
jgi:HlyD family secretion protein